MPDLSSLGLGSCSSPSCIVLHAPDASTLQSMRCVPAYLTNSSEAAGVGQQAFLSLGIEAYDHHLTIFMQALTGVCLHSSCLRLPDGCYLGMSRQDHQAGILGQVASANGTESDGFWCPIAERFGSYSTFHQDAAETRLTGGELPLICKARYRKDRECRRTTATIYDSHQVSSMTGRGAIATLGHSSRCAAAHLASLVQVPAAV